MKKTNILLYTALLSLFLFYSCEKNKNTSTGNPLVSATMTGSSSSPISQFTPNKYDLLLSKSYALPPPSNLTDAASSTITLSDFWINIAELELKPNESPDGSEVDGENIEFAGPYTINLFSSSPQSFASSNISQNTIRRIKYKVKTVSDVTAGNPAGMVNYCFYITASVAGKNFTFRSSEELEYETSGPNLVSFGNNQNLLIEIQTASIFKKINLSNVSNNDIIDSSNKVATSNPCPSIDPSASDIYTCFIKGFQKETKVGKDEDGDNQFDSNEDTVN